MHVLINWDEPERDPQRPPHAESEEAGHIITCTTLRQSRNIYGRFNPAGYHDVRYEQTLRTDVIRNVRQTKRVWSGDEIYYVGVTGRVGRYKNGVLHCTQILNVDETRKQQRFLAIKGTLALTQRLCMTFLPITACQHQPFQR